MPYASLRTQMALRQARGQPPSGLHVRAMVDSQPRRQPLSGLHVRAMVDSLPPINLSPMRTARLPAGVPGPQHPQERARVQTAPVHSPSMLRLAASKIGGALASMVGALGHAALRVANSVVDGLCLAAAVVLALGMAVIELVKMVADLLMLGDVCLADVFTQWTASYFESRAQKRERISTACSFLTGFMAVYGLFLPWPTAAGCTVFAGLLYAASQRVRDGYYSDRGF